MVSFGCFLVGTNRFMLVYKFYIRKYVSVKDSLMCFCMKLSVEDKNESKFGICLVYNVVNIF